jgi:uncharacterized protein involved in exopolysaccharide biosynthesis
MQQIEDFKREFLDIFFAQRRIIIFVTSLISICAILIAFFWPPTYSATASILVRGKKAEKNPGYIEQGEIRPFKLTTEDLASEVEILTSHDVIKEALTSLKITVPVSPKNVEINKIKNSLKTEIIPASNVIQITLYDKNSKYATTMLKALMEKYTIYRMQVHNSDEAEWFFSQQAKKYKEGLVKKDEELMELVQKTKMSNPPKEIESNLLVKADFEQQLNILKNEAIEKKLYIEHLGKKLDSKELQFFSFIEDISISNSISGISVKLQELFIELGSASRTYHPSSEKVTSIEKQINDTYSKLKSEVIAYKEGLVNQLQITNKKIHSIESRINSINNRNVELQRQHIHSQRIETEAKLLQLSYETFSKRREEAKINSSVDAANLSSYVSIISRAFSSGEPVFPKKNIVIPLGIIVGFITACSLGFLREYFDHTFKKPSDVKDYASLPVIFSIPK